MRRSATTNWPFSTTWERHREWRNLPEAYGDCSPAVGYQDRAPNRRWEAPVVRFDRLARLATVIRLSLPLTNRTIWQSDFHYDQAHPTIGNGNAARQRENVALELGSRVADWVTAEDMDPMPALAELYGREPWELFDGTAFPCKRCGGEADVYSPGDGGWFCPPCMGEVDREYDQTQMIDRSDRQQEEWGPDPECPDCRGTGVVWSSDLPCYPCGGTGLG